MSRDQEGNGLDGDRQARPECGRWRGIEAVIKGEM